MATYLDEDGEWENDEEESLSRADDMRDDYHYSEEDGCYVPDDDDD